MNRTEKKQRARVKKQQAKLARYNRHGGRSRYALKKEGRNKIGGAPIPVVFGNVRWEQAQKLLNASPDSYLLAA
jgi:hypothetical protein